MASKQYIRTSRDIVKEFGGENIVHHIMRQII